MSSVLSGRMPGYFSQSSMDSIQVSAQYGWLGWPEPWPTISISSWRLMARCIASRILTSSVVSALTFMNQKSAPGGT